MKKKQLSIIGASILGLGFFYAFQADVLGNIRSSHDRPQIEVEAELENDEFPLDDFSKKTQGTIIAVTEDEYLLVQKLNLSELEIANILEDSMSSEYINDLMRLSAIEEALEVGTEIEISYTIETRSLPPLVPVQSYEIIK